VPSAGTAGRHLRDWLALTRKSGSELLFNTAHPQFGAALMDSQWRITATVEQPRTALMRPAARKDTLCLYERTPTCEKGETMLLTMPPHED
jgi:hypothetical protein